MKPIVAGSILVSVLFLAGCPSKDSSSSSGASPSGAGPLGNLEATQPVQEAWIGPDGAQLPMLYYGPQNVRISAQCRQPNGQLSCDAIRQLRSAPPIQISSRGGSPSMSMGTKGCLKMNYQLVTGRNSVGAEDGFCRFPDGSMVASGALEQYGMHITE
ncbi:MAG: hypothetical protein KIT84_04820 [Labilithrix sp.]|nr:hypothetical protein [Labilithrix sp.]MCW5810309.1 hypothetical protein [Labilithrix sp.]